MAGKKKQGDRCKWAQKDIFHAYHDREWGVPVHDDRLHFEFLVLEGAQAGLSWETILNKRAHYRKVYDRFDPARVARYGPEKVAALLDDAGIVRNRLKVAASIDNARAFLAVQREHGSFDRYVWGFTGGRTIQNRWRTLEEIPASTPEAEAMSKSLKKLGFRFVGPTICYAFMQAIGMVNDHVTGCPRHKELS